MTPPLRDIVEVAEACGLHLEPAGHELVALCPVHSDVVPSLFVNPEKQVFLCRACGTGGGADRLARFLGHDPAIALDPDADPLAIEAPSVRVRGGPDLGRRYCAASTLVRAGLVDLVLLRDLDAAAALADDERVAQLLDQVETNCLLTDRPQCAIL